MTLESSPERRRNLWYRLTEPPASIPEPEHQRRARLLASLLIILIPLYFAPELVRTILTGMMSVTLLTTTIFLVVSYGLSRSRRYTWGAMLTLSVLTINPIANIVEHADYSAASLTNSLVWIILPLVLSGLLLPLPGTTVLILADIVGTLLLVILPGVSILNILFPLSLTLLVSVIVLVAAATYGQDLGQIEEQSKALAERQHTLHLIISSMPNLLFTVDEDNCLLAVFAPPHFSNILGISNESYGQPLAGILPYEMAGQIDEVLSTVREAGLTHTRECALTVDGQTVWLEFEVSPVTGSSDALVVVDDITERKQAQEERERLIRELDAFAHTVAHDLKNPVSTIVGMAEVLAEGTNDIAPDEMRQYLQILFQSGWKINSIVEALLLLSGVRKMEINLKPLDTAHIVAETQQRLARMIKERQAAITAPPDWPEALGYAPWVEEIWVNYISNAIKYGGQPPRVELGAMEQPDGMVRFWVRDNGNGIAPKDQERLFTPFTQLKQLSTEGYGLGLSIVQRIVEKLGGDVGVESEVGQGSTFYFTLPTIR